MCFIETENNGWSWHSRIAPHMPALAKSFAAGADIRPLLQYLVRLIEGIDGRESDLRVCED
jgi:hypothetical protein